MNIVNLKQLDAFLAKGKGQDGKPIDVRTFDVRGRKSRRRLLTEVSNLEVVLDYMSAEGPSLGRILRVAMSSKLLLYTRTHVWLEWKREFKGKLPIIKRQAWTISETRRRGETPSQAAARGLQQEVRIDIKPKELEYDTPQPDVVPPPRESSVYADILTQELIQYFSYEVSDAFQAPPFIKDSGSEVFFEKVPMEDVDLELLAPYLKASALRLKTQFLPLQNYYRLADQSLPAPDPSLDNLLVGQL